MEQAKGFYFSHSPSDQFLNNVSAFALAQSAETIWFDAAPVEDNTDFNLRFDHKLHVF